MEDNRITTIINGKEVDFWLTKNNLGEIVLMAEEHNLRYIGQTCILAIQTNGYLERYASVTAPTLGLCVDNNHRILDE